MSKGQATVEFENRIAIKRPIDEVFRWLADASKAPEWQAGVEECRPDGSDPTSPGQRYIEVFKFMGRRTEVTLAVTDYEPNRKVSYQIMSGPFAGGWDYTVRDEDNGTLLTSHGTAEPGGFFKLAAPIVRQAMKRTDANSLAALKHILETERGEA